MRKTALIGIGLVLSLAAASCGSDDGGSSASTPSSSASALDDTTGQTSAPTSDPASASTAAPSNPGSSEPAAAESAPDTTEQQGEADESAVFRFGFAGSTLTLDPTQQGSPTAITYFAPIFDTLTVLTPAGNLEPGIATAWEFSDDGLTLELTVAAGRTFHDGSALDAAAVVANLDRARAEGTRTASGLVAIDSIESPDDTTVVIHLNKPASSLPSTLGDYAGMMVAPASFDDPNITTMPIGSGPFTVVENTEAHMLYERWDDYQGPADIQLAGIEIIPMTDDTARLNALRAGQIDAGSVRINQVAEARDAGLQLIQNERVQFYGYQLNAAQPELSSPEVRRAISHAIDRTTINEALYEGDCLPAAQFYPASFYAYDPAIDDEMYGGYDLELARELLATAGYPDGFSIDIITPAIPNYVSLSEVLQAQLGEIGIEATITTVEGSQFTTALREGNYDIGTLAIDPARPDPSAFLESYFLPGGLRTPASFEVPGLAELFEEIEMSFGDERIELIRDATELVLENGSPVVPVCTPIQTIVAQNGVHNVEPPSLGNFNFNEVWISK